MTIELEETAHGFDLTGIGANGKSTTIALSDADILTLVRSAQKIEQIVIAKRSPSAGAVSAPTPVSAVPVHGGSISFDPLLGDVLLTIRERNGHQQILALPLELARALLNELPAWIAQGEQASKRGAKN